MNVDRMLREITWEQLREWQTYAELDPYIEERADLRSAQICATLANINRRKGAAPYKVEDFLLKFGAKEKKQTWQEQKAIAAMIVATHNAGQK